MDVRSNRRRHAIPNAFVSGQAHHRRRKAISLPILWHFAGPQSLNKWKRGRIGATFLSQAENDVALRLSIGQPEPFELACDASCMRASWTSLADGSERSVDEKIAIRLRVSMTGVIRRPCGNPHQPSTPLKTRLPT